MDEHMLPPVLTPYAIRQRQTYAAASLRVKASHHEYFTPSVSTGGTDTSAASGREGAQAVPSGLVLQQRQSCSLVSLLTCCKEEVLTRERASPE